MREGKTEDKDLLADLQDVSDSERKTSTPESSLGMSHFLSLSVCSYLVGLMCVDHVCACMRLLRIWI